MLQGHLFDNHIYSNLRVPFLENIEDKDKINFMNQGRTYSCERKTLLFKHGDPVNTFYVICKGIVRLFQETSEGDEITTDIRIAGDTLGTTGIIGASGIHSCYAEAIDDLTVMAFSKEWFKIRMQNNSIARNIISGLSQRIFLQKLEAEQRATQSAEHIVACYLQRLCISHNLDPRQFILPFSKTLIATRLGMQRETLSRALARIGKFGVAISGKNVKMDVEKVRSQTCRNCSHKESCSVYKTA